MEHKIVKKKDGYEIIFQWEYTKHVDCGIHIHHPDLEKCFLVLAKELGASLYIELSGQIKDSRLLMAELGEMFAQAVCQRCSEIGTKRSYRGIGAGSLRDGQDKVSCELSLPGRTGWVYEVSSDCKLEDESAVFGFFESFASHAGLQLKFLVHDGGKKYGEKMFAAFGQALWESLLENP